MMQRLQRNCDSITAIGGSLLACFVTPQAVYLAADSRYVDAPLVLRDSARKLIACGATALCGLSGLLRFTRTDCDRRGSDVRRRTTFQLADVVEALGAEGALGDEPGLADLFARRLHLALAPIWERFTIDLDEPFGYAATHAKSVLPPLRLAQLLYANREPSGRAFLATIDLKHTLRRSLSGRYCSVLERPLVRQILFNLVTRPRLYVKGASQCVRPEPMRRSIGGDVEALRIIEGVFERARYSGRCAAAIGGPIDIAVIDMSGRRWLRQKSEGQIVTDGSGSVDLSDANDPVPPR